MLDNKEVYSKWKRLVNMSKSELQTFFDSAEGKRAGLSAKEAKEQGIDSGRESAGWVLKMKSTNVNEWTPTMWRWANKQISFISRMRGVKGDLYDKDGNKTRKHLALLIWGHNPKKFADGGSIGSNDAISRHKTQKEYSMNKKSNTMEYEMGGIFHGSPYKFDKFTTESIGTGEGAQAFGWGLYFTDLESIGEMYARNLAQGKSNSQSIAQYVYGTGYTKEQSDEIMKMPVQSQIEMINSAYDAKIIKLNQKEDSDFKKHLIETQNKLKDTLISEAYQVSPFVYKVTLFKGKKPEEYNWLEWHKSITEKNKDKIVNGLLPLIEYGTGFGGRPYLKFPSGKTINTNIQKSEIKDYLKEGRIYGNGSDVYSQLTSIIGSPKETSLFLLHNGIDGVKYPAESISKGKTEETSKGFNYVVFDENAVNIEDVKQLRKGGTISQTPAPLSDKIKGSKLNKVGSATSKGSSNIELSDRTTEVLKEKLAEFKKSNPNNDKITLNDLKAVYRRGSGAYSTSHRPNITRAGWSYARVNKFLEKAAGKKVKAAYVQDDDLLKYENGGLIAPNGNKSNLTPEQYKLVRTSQFKKWFGDWENSPETSSKVVDENGEPLVVYHGTSGDLFYEFMPFAVDYYNGEAIKEFRGNRTKEEFDEYIKINGLRKITTRFWFSTKHLWGNKFLACFLSIKNIFITDEYEPKLQLGVDGFKVPNEDGIDYYCVSESNQIKLADGTNTTFDGDNLDIRFKEGGETFNDKELLARFNNGESIGFTAIAHLKAKGLIPRADGNKKVSQKYMEQGGKMDKTITCMNCGWHWLESQTEEYDKYLCHKCGFDNWAFYETKYDKGGGISYNEYKNSQFNEEENKYLPSDYLTPFEIQRNKKDKYSVLLNVENGIEYRLENGSSFVIGAFDGEDLIGYVDNGAVEVSPEYQKRGIGLNLITLIKERNPKHRFGSMTPQGFNLMGAYYDKKIANKSKFELGGLIAPNGKQSNLTEEQYKLVRSPQFKAWFGDWENDPQNASKVVDENGEPLICYHGTNSNFTIFRAEKPTIAAYGQGFYFSNDKGFASNYARGENGRILQVFLNIRKIFEINNDELPSGYEGYSSMIDNKGVSRDFTKKIISQNYDGVYAKNRYDDELVVFNSNQVKLADGTNTTFDNSNADIRYDKGGISNFGKAGTGFDKYEKEKGTYDNRGVALKQTNDVKTLGSKLIISIDSNNKFAWNLILENGSLYASKGGFNTQQDAINNYMQKPFKDGGLIGLDSTHIHTKLVQISKKFKVPLSYIEAQLKDGLKAEGEHTKDKSVAAKIALDHLTESPYYYQKLQQMEKELETMNADKYLPRIMSVYENGGTIDMIYKLNTPSKEPTKLNYIQQVLVRTTEFKKWFGDWETAAKNFIADNYENFEVHYKDCSKVIDLTTYEPSIEYHGSNADAEFYKFNVTKEQGLGRPYGYFADNVEYSQNFTQYSQRGTGGVQLLYKCFLKIDNPFFAISSEFYDRQDGHRYWLKMIAGQIFYQKYQTVVYDVRHDRLKEAIESQIGDYVRSVFTGDGSFWLLMARDVDKIFKTFLISYGFTGVRYAEEFSSNYDTDNRSQFTKAWTVFDAGQIKLADGRNIGFDPFNKDIRFEQGGETSEPIETKQQDMTRAHKMRQDLGLDNEMFADGGTVFGDGKNTNNAKDGGYFKGQSHANGGIKAINKDTGQMLEVEGDEVIINKRSVADTSKKEFEGEMLTNREILSKINQMGGGVAFADGGEINEKTCGCMGKKYKFGGELVSDYEIVKNLTNNAIFKPLKASVKYVEDLITRINK